MAKTLNSAKTKAGLYYIKFTKAPDDEKMDFILGVCALLVKFADDEYLRIFAMDGGTDKPKVRLNIRKIWAEFCRLVEVEGYCVNPQMIDNYARVFLPYLYKKRAKRQYGRNEIITNNHPITRKLIERLR